VHRVVRNDVPFVLLYGAAYCRYLTASNEASPFGHRGKLVVQGVYDHPAVSAVIWTAVEAEDEGYVLLRHISDRLTMTHWVVEAIPLLQMMPSLQHQVHNVSSPSHLSLVLLALIWA
jgi:hypothetical protein